MKVIIIEDEPLMAQELQSEIHKADAAVEIVGIFESIKDTLAYLAAGEYPDLFFSDIHLADGLSFEIFEQLDVVIPVVFCTAYDQYALTAFKANGIDYLVKPLDANDVANTLLKFKSLKQTNAPDVQFSALRSAYLASQAQDDRNALLVHKGHKIYPIKKEDIRIIYLSNGITYLIDKNTNKHNLNFTMDSLENMLNPQHFFRANRQFIVHREAISHVSHYFARKLLVHLSLTFNEEIVVSKANAPKLLKWLQH